jgi:hypothetical protein
MAPRTDRRDWPSFSTELLAILAKRQAEETYGVPLSIEYIAPSGWVVRVQAGLERRAFDEELIRVFLCGVLFGAEASGAMSEETPPTPSLPSLPRASPHRPNPHRLK